MTAIQLLACAGMIVGVFLLLEMKPVEFTDSLFGFLLNPKRSLREDIRESSGRKKSGILRRELKEAQNILQMTGRGNRFSFICAVALALFCAGGSIAILLGNFFLAPVMAVGFLFLPFWYVKLTANHYKRDVSAELETALSVSAMELVIAANNTSKKNRIPIPVPRPILANTFGMVINISAGPAFSVSGSPPEKANTAGMIIRPAIMAIAVSKISTFWVESSMDISFNM